MASKSASKVLLSSMEDALGVEAVQYFVCSASNNVLSEFTGSCGNPRPEVQEALCKIVEWFDWSYAIYWQVSASKSVKSALIWGACHCQVAREGSTNDGKDQRLSDGAQRKEALQKLEVCFHESGDDGIYSSLDFISELEIFYHTSKYFAFPSDNRPSPYQAFDSGKAIWVTNPKCFPEHYQSWAFLATAVQLQTVAFIQLEPGIVEIGSRKYLGKDMKIIDIVKDIFGSNLMEPKTFPRILGQELCLGGAKSSADSEDDNLIEMARTILRSCYAKENMVSNDIVQDLSPGGAKSSSISTRSSSNIKYSHSIEAKNQRPKERLKKSSLKKIIKLPALETRLSVLPSHGIPGGSARRQS